jgi:DNA-binding LacI/PurR family transcriptional regulator
MSDGMLVNYQNDLPPRVVELLRKDGLPSIWLNTKLEDDCVYLADFEAAELLVDHLIQTGRRRIAYFGYDTHEHYSDLDRRDGYLAGIRRGGLSSIWCLTGRERWALDHRDFSRDKRREALHQLLAPPSRPDAIVCYSSFMATAAVAVALQLGLRIPEDLAITCVCDTVPIDTGLVVTTAMVSQEEMGRVAVQMLLRKIESKRQRQSPQAIRAEFIRGQTS